jgi:site-specific DNA-methyltransferase (adenine-specific)
MMELILGDSFVQLDGFKENTFEACVTDPPYGLTSIVKRFGKKDSVPAKEGTDGRFSRLSKGFLGQEWDGSGIEQDPIFWNKVLQVIKPGGYLLAFSSPRTYHRMATAIEDAGFEIRDMIGWLYGQGFPKSHDIADGVGTNLKPAFEPIVMARKPISESTNIRNFERWGTGGINIDDCRIPLNGEVVPINKLEKWSGFGQAIRPDYEQEINTKGRWPSNLVLDDSDLLDNKSRFFYCAKPSKKEKGIAKDHPTVKPLDLMMWLVKLVAKTGPVLDPFMGSGTTGLACKKLNIMFTGIEAVNSYYDLAVQRMIE